VNIGQPVQRAGTPGMLRLQITTDQRAKPTHRCQPPKNNDKIMNEAMRATHGRHVLASLALHLQHS
jgi:hypothetical protein